MSIDALDYLSGTIIMCMSIAGLIATSLENLADILVSAPAGSEFSLRCLG